MLERYGKMVYRFRWVFLLVSLAFMAGAGYYASGVYNSLSQGGFNVPGSQSDTVSRITAEQFGGNQDSLIILLSSSKLHVSDPAFQQAADTLLAPLQKQPAVTGVQSYFAGESSQFVSQNGHETYVLVGLKGTDSQQANEVNALRPQLHSRVLNVQLGGAAAINAESTAYVKHDLERAEYISFPVTAILLVAVFGSLVAASLPLAVGLFGIVGAIVITRLIALATNMSVYVLDLISLLGLGLAIDYSLFIVNRYREEMSRPDHTIRQALARTFATAGRTVLFSGLTVLVALAGLIIFPVDYLRSMGIGGSVAVLVALVGALFFLPAILALLGERVNALRLIKIMPLSTHAATARGIWWHICQAVLKRPIATVIVTLGVLIAAGLPFWGIRFVNPDYRILPVGSQARAVGVALQKDFKLNDQAPIQVVVKRIPGNDAAVANYRSQLQKLTDVAGVQSLQSPQYTLINVMPRTDTYNTRTEQLVTTVKEVSSPHLTRWVGGQTAELMDLLATIRHDGIYALIVILGAMLFLFFLLLGSIVIPLKTIILNILSLSAAFGALVWIFQDGHLAGLFGISPLEGLDATQPVIIFALAFGLSMDYAVFLFSRVKEHFDENTDIEKAIAWGVQKTGGIITSAAALLLAVIAAFAAGRIVVMKEVGIGLIVAVLVDIFIVRLLLVPASMKLLGKYNWWAPKPLAKLYKRFGIKEID